MVDDILEQGQQAKKNQGQLPDLNTLIKQLKGLKQNHLKRC